MSIGQHQTASGRPLRVAPAWVGGAQTTAEYLPVREAVWIWSVRRYARISLWALPLGAVLYGWTTLGVAGPPGTLLVQLVAGWLCAVAMIGLAGLLSGSRTRRSALVGLLVGMAGFMLMLPLAALPEGVGPAGSGLSAAQVHAASLAAAAIAGVGWLLLGWAVFRSKLVNPADGVLLMLAAISIGAGSYAVRPLPTVGALLLLAAGMGLAWTGSRLIPPA
ncbi:hypothetical protein ACIBSW_16030 [Actinoplanes sp. NPDC049668]|uniref:hypothetical protein n=1 Tax=unclassified Actinoplanes TaxID=2626549 RepID=UPI0033BF5AA0